MDSASVRDAVHAAHAHAAEGDGEDFRPVAPSLRTELVAIVMEKNPFREHRSTTVAFLSNSRRIARARAFYETAGGVKVFVLHLFFPYWRFCFCSCRCFCLFLACCIHLGLLSALCLTWFGFGACWCPMTMKCAAI